MGTYAIMAATNLFNQLQSVYSAAGSPKTAAQLWQMVGVTPMLGVNDAEDEVFDQAAAAQLVNYAESKNIGMLAFWSLNRDQPGDSGITQTAYQFTGIFLPFGGGGSPTPVVSAANAGVVMPTNGFANLFFPVTLSAASTGAVSVAWFTSNGTAAAPGDYLATNGTLMFAAGQTSNAVSVLVPGHTNVGANKVLYLNLTNAAGAELFSPQATGTITNLNSSGGGGATNSAGGAGGITWQWLVTYDAGAFQAVLTLSNPGHTNITINTFSFDAPWSGVDWIADNTNQTSWVAPTHSGSQFAITGGWPVAAVLPAGGSLQLTFQAAPGGNPPAPSNLAINGSLLATLYFTSVARNGQNIVLTWQTIGGTTNWLQTNSILRGTNWGNLGGPMVIPGSGSVATNWTDLGGAASGAARFYRLLTP
jgi:hypothetical protein